MKKNIKMSLTLLLLGITIYIVGIYFTPTITNIPAENTFGLLEELNPLVMVGIIFTVISMAFLILSNSREFYFLFSLVILSIMIWGTPSFVESLPRMWDVYYFAYILRQVYVHGYVNFSWSTQPYLDYVGFPLSFILITMVLRVFGTDIYDLGSFMAFLKYYPLLSAPLIVISMYVLFKKTTEIRKARFSSLLYLLLTPTLYTHLCPQSMALVVYPLFLAFLVWGFNRVTRTNLLIVGIFFLMFLAGAHPTTAVINILFLTIYIPLNYLFQLREHSTNTWDIVSIYVMSIISFLSWFSFAAYHLFNVVITVFVIKNLRNLLNPGIISSENYSHVFTLPQKIRAGFFFIGLFVSLLYTLFYAYKQKRSSVLYLSIIIMVGVFVVLDIFIMGGHFGERAYVWGYVSISYSLGSLIVAIYTKNSSLKLRNILVVISCIIFMVNTTTFYYTESRDFYSNSIVEGYEFIVDVSNGTYSLDLTRNPLKIFLVTNPELFFNLTKSNIPLQDILETLKHQELNNTLLPHYVVVSDKSLNGIIRQGYLNEYQKLQSSIALYSCRAIYDSPAMIICIPNHESNDR